MRLVKRGKTYSIVYEDAGHQRWVATGLSDRAAAEQLIVKERKKQERVRAGLSPATENPNLKLLIAVKGFMKRKRQLSKAQQKALRRRLLVCSYEILGKRRIKHQVRARHIREKIKPFLRGRRLLEITAPLVERWLDGQLLHGRGKSGFKGASYKTVKDKVRLVSELMDFWYRRKKILPEDPLARLDMPKPNEVPNNSAPRKERRAFEVDEIVEFFRAVGDLDRARLAKLFIERRKQCVVRCPVLPIFRTLLATGARTSEILTTPMHECVLDGGQYFYIPKERCKTKAKGERRATMHPAIAKELMEYRAKYRAAAAPEDMFLLGPEGTKMDTARLLDQFYAGVYLAFVRMEARAANIELLPGDDQRVALYIWKKKIQSIGGSRLRPETLVLREGEEIRIKKLASRLMLAVRKRMKGLDVYALRHTHGTWAADQEVPEIHISKQLGHRIQGITGRYISSRSVKLIDPGRSSRAVWEMLMAAERAAAPAEESAVMMSATA